jgi:hypothetical protein
MEGTMRRIRTGVALLAGFLSPASGTSQTPPPDTLIRGCTAGIPQRCSPPLPGETASVRYARTRVPFAVGRLTNVAPGWSLTMRMTIDSGGGRAPTTVAMKMLGAGRKVRQEMIGPGLPPMVSIMDMADSTMTVVMEQMGMGMLMRIPSSVADLAAGGKHTNVKTSRADLGPGEQVNGFPTTRHRVTLTSTVTQSLGATTCSRPQVQEIEIWIVDDPVLPRVMAEFTAAMPQVSTPAEDPREMLRLAGVDPVKQGVTRMVSRDVRAGSGAKLAITVDFTDYAILDVDLTKLTPPAGVQVQDMRSMDVSALAGGAMNQLRDRMFWTLFDTTAAAGADRATCARK